MSVALAISAGAFVPTSAQAATTWNVKMGAESTNEAIQLAYFYPNNITINKGDTVTFYYNTGEPHSTIVMDANHNVLFNSGAPTAKGTAPVHYTFNQVGDFRLQCGLHPTMSGTVHVNAAGTAYPKTQHAYDVQSQLQQNAQLAEGGALYVKTMQSSALVPGNKAVTVGVDAVHDAGAIFIMRFMKQTLNVKVGDTVTFTNMSTEAPHTVTMNEDGNPAFLFTQPDNLDAAGHATLYSPTDRVSSGWLWNEWFQPPPPFPPIAKVGTVFKVTFKAPGTYNYYCDLHDVLGMKGKVVVAAQ